jgi:hypothetical protein
VYMLTLRSDYCCVQGVVLKQFEHDHVGTSYRVGIRGIITSVLELRLPRIGLFADTPASALLIQEKESSIRMTTFVVVKQGAHPHGFFIVLSGMAGVWYR